MASHHLGETPSLGTFHEKFAAVPLSAWEDELPVLDACIKESQRIVVSGITVRRNHYEEVKIGEQAVRRGDFLVYSMADVHLNPECYPEPYKYDPGRWLRPDPVPKTIYPFVGWGAGRHPCTGMKLAKLEMKLIVALYLTRYEFELVDKDGKFPDPLPVPNWNDHLLVRAELWIKYSVGVFTLRLPRLSPSGVRVTSSSRRLNSRRDGHPIHRRALLDAVVHVVDIDNLKSLHRQALEIFRDSSVNKYKYLHVVSIDWGSVPGFGRDAQNVRADHGAWNVICMSDPTTLAVHLGDFRCQHHQYHQYQYVQIIDAVRGLTSNKLTGRSSGSPSTKSGRRGARKW